MATAVVEHNLKVLMRSEAKEPTPLSGELLRVILEGLALVSRHFRVELDEALTETYVQGLRSLNSARVAGAFTLALQRMKRMPLIADLRELADDVELPEEKIEWFRPRDDQPGRTLREVRDVMDEIAMERFEKTRDRLSDNERFQCAVAANELRLARLRGSVSRGKEKQR